MRRTRYLSLLLCTVAPCVAIIVVMTAAAGDHPDDPAGAADALGPRTLATATEATRAATSARVELRTIVTGPAGPVALVHRGAFADGGVRARAESDMSEVASALEAAGQELDGDWSSPTGIVVDGDSVFSQLGPMAEALGRAPHDWARARLSEVAGPASLADNDTLVLALDPLGPLDLLRHPVVEIGLVGDDEVRGTPTRHVRARLDLAPEGATGSGGEESLATSTEVVADLDGGDDEPGRSGVEGNGSGAGRNGVPHGTAEPGPPAGSFEARLVAAGITSLPVDVWLDEAGAVRRLTVTIDGAASVTTTFEVYDIGADVDITPPDPAEVIDPGDLSGD